MADELQIKAAAEALARDPGFNQAVANLRRRYAEALMSTGISEPDVRENLYRKNAVLNDVLLELAELTLITS